MDWELWEISAFILPLPPKCKKYRKSEKSIILQKASLKVILHVLIDIISLFHLIYNAKQVLLAAILDFGSHIGFFLWMMGTPFGCIQWATMTCNTSIYMFSRSGNSKMILTYVLNDQNGSKMSKIPKMQKIDVSPKAQISFTKGHFVRMANPEENMNFWYFVF